MSPNRFIILLFLTFAYFGSFLGATDSWDKQVEYQRGVVVSHEAKFYLAKEVVPTGIELSNTNYWLDLERDDPTTPPSENPGEGNQSMDNPPVEIPQTNALVTFSYGFRNVEDYNSENYLIEKENIKKFIDGNNPLLSYWGPATNDSNSYLTFRFDFNGSVKTANLTLKLNSYNYSSNSNLTGSGQASVWVSNDASVWTRIVENPTPSEEASEIVLDQSIPSEALNADRLFIKVEMQSSSAPLDSYSSVQFAPASLNSQDFAFYLDVSYDPQDDDPSKINYDKGLSDGIQFVLNNLSTYGLYSESQLQTSIQSTSDEQTGIIIDNPSAYGLISLSDFNQTMENKIKEDSFQLGFAMLTELVQNENTSPSVQGRALENGFVWTGDGKDSLHTPLAIGWFFLEEIGWLWTNPSTYPYVYRFGQNDQTSSWLYFKEGSTPPRYYDFGTRVWFEITE